MYNYHENDNKYLSFNLIIIEMLKKIFPHRESNPGRLRERQES